MFCNLEGLILYVADLAPGKDFYARVLQLPIRLDTPSCVVFHIPNAKLILKLDEEGAAPSSSATQPHRSKRSALALIVEDIDSTLFHLNKHRVPLLSPIEERGGLWVCEIEDPYGNRIAIAQLNEIRG
jgi:predicted enzyme related to lactoylglutathione lyase